MLGCYTVHTRGDLKLTFLQKGQLHSIMLIGGDLKMTLNRKVSFILIRGDLKLTFIAVIQKGQLHSIVQIKGNVKLTFIAVFWKDQLHSIFDYLDFFIHQPLFE